MSSGIYTLLIELDADAAIEVGALGTRPFDAGWYAYTGSARGPGGFVRVERHRELAAGERSARHWHVDHLLGAPGASIEGVVTSPGVDAECGIARAVGGRPIEGFGVSDCDCDSHLAFAPERAVLVASVRSAHDGAET
ncbi:MAG: DUF123 domain-containing protein [Halobacteriales archaeon]